MAEGLAEARRDYETYVVVIIIIWAIISAYMALIAYVVAEPLLAHRHVSANTTFVTHEPGPNASTLSLRLAGATRNATYIEATYLLRFPVSAGVYVPGVIVLNVTDPKGVCVRIGPVVAGGNDISSLFMTIVGPKASLNYTLISNWTPTSIMPEFSLGPGAYRIGFESVVGVAPEQVAADLYPPFMFFHLVTVVHGEDVAFNITVSEVTSASEPCR